MKKILVIDDSALMRRAISDIIENTNEYCVAYNAKDGVEGLEIIKNSHDISVVFCDIAMPRMDGLELLQVLKKKNINVPVVMFSSSDDTSDTITALQLGAIEFIKKPERILGRESIYFEKRVKKALDIASNVHNIKVSGKKAKVQTIQKKSEKDISKKSSKKKSKLIAICCSTGGPRALQSVLPYIPANIAAPIILVQHMPVGFTATLADRLNDLSEIKVKEAENYEILRKGVCYIAKGGTHLTIEDDEGGAPRIVFDDSPAVVGLKPCGNIMYNSLCDLSSFDEIICVILTGMGEDGTKGILKLSQHKKVYVIAQDEKSSTVYGMPRAIYERGLTDCVCDINKIPKEITKKVGVL